MKKIKFLIKLKKEGKIEVVEPSNEIKESYLIKSESHLEAAKILLDSRKMEESISMAYYGMYHSLVALLFKCGIKCENHSASIMLLKELFDQKELAEVISFGKKERIDKQYYTDFKLTEFDCRDMLKKAEDFIIQIKTILRNLNEEKIQDIRRGIENGLN